MSKILQGNLLSLSLSSPPLLCWPPPQPLLGWTSLRWRSILIFVPGTCLDVIVFRWDSLWLAWCCYTLKQSPGLLFFYSNLRSLTPISRFVAVGLLPEQPDGPQSPFPVAKLEAQYREKRWQFSATSKQLLFANDYLQMSDYDQRFMIKCRE